MLVQGSVEDDCKFYEYLMRMGGSPSLRILEKNKNCQARSLVVQVSFQFQQEVSCCRATWWGSPINNPRNNPRFSTAPSICDSRVLQALETVSLRLGHCYDRGHIMKYMCLHFSSPPSIIWNSPDIWSIILYS